MKSIIRILVFMFLTVGLGSPQEVVTVTRGVVPAVPTFAPDGPYSDGATSVTIGTISGSAYYCTGASDCDPTSGTLYSTPVSISSTTHLCALSKKAGFSNSGTHCGTYTIVAGPSFVQASPTNCRTFGGTSATCTFGSNVTVNDFLYFVIFVDAGTITIDGTAGVCHGASGWTQDTPVGGISHATVKANGTGSCTVTVSSSSSTNLRTIGIEISGASAVDVRSAMVSQGFIGAGSSSNCPAVTTTVANDLVVCGLVDSDQNASTFTAGTNFTTRVSSTTQPSAVETYLKPASGSITPTWGTLGGNATVYTGTVAFKP